MASLLHDAPIARLKLICPASCLFADWVQKMSVLHRTHQSRWSRARYLMSYQFKKIELNNLLIMQLISKIGNGRVISIADNGNSLS